MKHLERIGRKTRRFIAENTTLPTADDFALTPSLKMFGDGTQYGIEISSVNNPRILDKVIDLAKVFRITINRVDETRGIFRLTDEDIEQMVQNCHVNNIGLIMSVGPRAIYDTGGFVHSRNGFRVGYRLRGMENVIRAVEDVKRAIELGVRGFLIYDEGLLALLSMMRSKREFPKGIVFKFSVHNGCCNPVSADLFQGLGADSINMMADIEIPMLAATRQAIDCPIDLFTDTSKEGGGLIRTYDVPNFILVAAPVYLKCGPSSQERENYLPTDDELNERMRQTKCVLETIERHCPYATQLKSHETTLALPVV